MPAGELHWDWRPLGQGGGGAAGRGALSKLSESSSLSSPCLAGVSHAEKSKRIRLSLERRARLAGPESASSLAFSLAFLGAAGCAMHEVSADEAKQMPVHSPFELWQ